MRWFLFSNKKHLWELNNDDDKTKQNRRDSLQELRQDLHLALVSLRQQEHKSVEEMAEFIHCPPRLIQNLENGKTTPYDLWSLHFYVATAFGKRLKIRIVP